MVGCLFSINTRILHSIRTLSYTSHGPDRLHRFGLAWNSGESNALCRTDSTPAPDTPFQCTSRWCCNGWHRRMCKFLWALWFYRHFPLLYKLQLNSTVVALRCNLYLLLQLPHTSRVFAAISESDNWLIKGFAVRRENIQLTIIDYSEEPMLC